MREKIEKRRFKDTMSYFEKESLKFPEKIVESKNQFTIDF